MAADKPLISTFQEAARIAESVPEQYREAAFQRALDALLSPMPVPDSREAPQTAPKKIGHEQEPRVGGNNALERLLSAVDSSAHQKIHDAPSLLDRCLIVLRIAKSNYGVDGLTTTEVGTR